MSSGSCLSDARGLLLQSMVLIGLGGLYNGTLALVVTVRGSDRNPALLVTLEMTGRVRAFVFKLLPSWQGSPLRDDAFVYGLAALSLRSYIMQRHLAVPLLSSIKENCIFKPAVSYYGTLSHFLLLKENFIHSVPKCSFSFIGCHRLDVTNPMRPSFSRKREEEKDRIYIFPISQISFQGSGSVVDILLWRC